MVARLSRLAAAAGLELPRGPEATAPGARAPGEDEFRRQLTRVIASKTRDEWARVLAEYDCCCEPVLELDELTEHPLHRERGLFFEIGESGSPATLQVRTPLGMPAGGRPAPALGQHNDEVFREYGVNDTGVV